MTPPPVERLHTLGRFCNRCQAWKPYGAFSPHHSTKDRVEHTCKACRAASRRLTEASPGHRNCIGYEGYGCGKRVRRHARCGPCQVAHQHLVEERALAIPLALGPKMCGLDGCREIVLDGSDRRGRATMYCATHGERLAPRLLPRLADGSRNPAYPKAPKVSHHKGSAAA